MTLFDRVKEISKQKGYTLAELAERAGIGEKSMYTWKPSANFPYGVTPKRATLEKVADALGVSVDYLLGNTDAPTVKNVGGDNKPVDIEKALDNAVAYGGKPMTDNDRMILKGLIEAYLKNKEG
jgi:transcriptional regulator with XRE-family HTH domain